LQRVARRRDVRIAAGSVLALSVLCFIALFSFYVRLAHVIDRRLAAGPFSNTTNIFSAAHPVVVGDPLTLEQFLALLQRSGYTNVKKNPGGWFVVRGSAVEVTPVPNRPLPTRGAEFAHGNARIASPDRRRFGNRLDLNSSPTSPALRAAAHDPVLGYTRLLVHAPFRGRQTFLQPFGL
jgi:hypothetical protein